LNISFPWWKPTAAAPVLRNLRPIDFCEPSVYTMMWLGEISREET